MARHIELNTTEQTVTLTEYAGKWMGEDMDVQREEVYAITDLPEHIQNHCALHGLAQKLSDQTSAMSDAKGFTVTERFDTIDALFDQLKDGNWKRPSTGGAGKLSQTAIKNKMDSLGLTAEQYEMAKQLGLIKG